MQIQMQKKHVKTKIKMQTKKAKKDHAKTKMSNSNKKKKQT